MLLPTKHMTMFVVKSIYIQMIEGGGGIGPVIRCQQANMCYLYNITHKICLHIIVLQNVLFQKPPYATLSSFSILKYSRWLPRWPLKSRKPIHVQMSFTMLVFDSYRQYGIKGSTRNNRAAVCALIIFSL